MNVAAERLYRYWLMLLGGKASPPPFSIEKQEAWKSGYEDAIRDLAVLKTEGRLDR